MFHGTELSAPSGVTFHGQQRRLGEKAWMLAVMRLCGMDEERMTQVHGAGIACGRHDWTMGAARESIGGKLPQRQPRFSRGRKLPSDVRV